MAAKKVGSLSKLTFNELKDKVKDAEGLKSMNRFEITALARKAENLPELAAANPRSIKPEIAALKAKLADAGNGDKKNRKDLRRAVARLKRNSRKYFA